MKYSTWQEQEPSQEDLETLEQQDLKTGNLVYIGVPPVPSGGYAGLVLDLYGKESEDSTYGNAEYAGVIER